MHSDDHILEQVDAVESAYTEQIRTDLAYKAFFAALAEDWMARAIQKYWDILHDPWTSAYEWEDKLKQVIPEMDHGDIPHIIEMYVEAAGFED